MSETAAVELGRRRRSREEAERLVWEYERSGMTRGAFCRQHGLSVATLDKYRQRCRPNGPADADAVRPRRSSVRLVAVDLVDRVAVSSGLSGEATLFVELDGGRRIGVAAGFNAATSRPLIGHPIELGTSRNPFSVAVYRAPVHSHYSSANDF
jgi:transposase-like protein